MGRAFGESCRFNIELMDRPMKTVIVAGGAGFIGANFVRRALARGDGRQDYRQDYRIVVFDKLTYAGNLLNLREVEQNPRFNFVRGDIMDRRAVRNLLAELHPAAILNFAAETHVDRSIDGPRDFVETNVVGTFELLETARGFYQELPPAERASFRFLHVSTDEVYGSLGDGRASVEEDPYAPNSPYAASKAAADHFVRAYHVTYGLPVLTTNCSNNYGSYQYPEKLIPLLIAIAIAGKPLPVYGDGLNVRDWIFVEDHCAALLAVLERGTLGDKYNIGANCERTNLALIGELCATLDELAPPRQNPALSGRSVTSYRDLITFVRDRPGHDRRYALDSGLIRRELGWSPQVALADGLRATARWYLDNRDWCARVQEGRYRGERLGLATGPDDPVARSAARESRQN
jgi:dTDP-glucose 4,6-dehydratase